MTADIVDLADLALVDYEVNSTAVVFDIQPIADVQTLTINRERLARAFAIIRGMSFSGKW